MTSEIHAAIVTYKKPERLAKLIEQLQSQDCDIEIHVHDNSEQNIHYTAGVNVGVKRALKSGAKYVLLLADDVSFLKEDTVSKLYNYMESDHGCGMASTLHLDENNNVTFGGGDKCFPWGHHMNAPLDHEIYNAPYSIPWANTSCVLVRREAIEECGLLDETMKFICSDSDYSLTLRSRGWSVDLIPDAQILHSYGMASKNTGMDQLNKIKHEDSLRFMNKWITGGIFQELSVEGRNLTVDIIKNRYEEIIQTLNHYNVLSAAPGNHNPGATQINLG